MSLLKNNNLKGFDQSEYDASFYYCEEDHEFIAFTTCFCPLCEANKLKNKYDNQIDEVESQYESLLDQYLDLKIKVRKVNPELLI